MGTESRQYQLVGDRLQCTVQADGVPWLRMLVDRAAATSLLAEPSQLCTLSVKGVMGHAEISPASAGGLCIRWTGLPSGTEVELLATAEGSSLRLCLMGAGTGDCQVSFPFVRALQLSRDPERPDRVLEGERSFRDQAGNPIFSQVDFPLPFVRIGPDGRTLTFLLDPASAHGPVDMAALTRPPGCTVLLQPERRTLLEAELILHKGGWPAAFALFRDRVRRLFDLSQYRRPDTAWFQDQFVQHFTFLFGREILNLETGRWDVDRFLDEAERNFGGYDGILLWGVYPRLGIDERTQWDFYDDFPGGREELRRLSRRARERGVRVFLPYLPWDQSAESQGGSCEPAEQALARLVSDVEADGVFLDTLSAISPSFRVALDQARPGVVFCSEGRVKGQAFEIITGSWDETSMARGVRRGNWSAAPEPMPSVNLWRFLFPDHRFFVLNRHGMGEHRIRMIQRGFFAGMGWVVWQDIFGLAHPYTPDEAALLKQCRTIFREHREALHSPEPTPLVETLHPSLLANEFPVAAKRLWTLYNQSDEPLHGPLLQIQPRDGFHLVDLWNNREVPVDQDGRLILTVGPRSVGAVAELPVGRGCPS